MHRRLALVSMKLFLLRPNHQFYGNSMSLRAFLFSTQALKRMIMRPADPKASVVPILENWVQQGNAIKHSQLRKLITNIRSAHLFNPALQMLQWMGNKGVYELSAADFALQLELTSRVGGIQQVETYFDTIPYNLRGYEVYCALLTSYAHHDCLEKAEATMQILEDLGFLRNVSPYNVMFNFYYKIQYDINFLVEEMREKGIKYNRTTYNILLKVYGGYYKSIEKMDQLLAELEADPLVNADWYHYLLAAEGYWNVWRTPRKTLPMLNKSEESMGRNLKRFACELLTLHASIGIASGDFDNVYRLWSLHKLHKGFYNKGYLCMIKFFIDIRDIRGAERIWEEWFSKKKEMDFRIPQAMIRAYALKRQWKKAEAIAFRMTESGIEPDADTLEWLAFAYWRGSTYTHEGPIMEKAVETLAKAISVSKPGWKPDLSTLADADYFGYLARKGDGVAMDELYKMLREHCGVPSGVCDELRYYFGKNPRVSSR